MTSEQSEVQQFYCGSTVLITGGSGFLGKVLIEKLLRACPQIRQIVLLMRKKRGAKSWQRLEYFLNENIFKELSQETCSKVTVVEGDCQLPDLGISKCDRKHLVDTVDIVFHVAASIRFDDGLASAVATNLVGTKAMLDLARDMAKLKAFVYVSTAYSNCDESDIQEKFYPPKYNPINLIKLTEALDEPLLDQLTPVLLGGLPNTYVYTKAAAEDLVRTYSKGLPVSVFRPSIVISTRGEPVPGWTDNLHGPSGLVMAMSSGIVRTLWCDGQKTADVVPVDMVDNALIVTAWATHSRSIESGSDIEPQVFNFVSSPERPIQWNQFIKGCRKHHLPSIHSVWIFSVWMTRYRILHMVLHVFLHLLPAYMIHATAQVFGVSLSLLKISRRLKKVVDSYGYFTTREWTFSNFNTQQLWLRLSSQDQKLFPFSFADFNWDSYLKTYMFGLRQYLIRDDLSTLPRAVTKQKRLSWMNRALQVTVLFTTSAVICCLFNLSSVSYQLTSYTLRYF